MMTKLVKLLNWKVGGIWAAGNVIMKAIKAIVSNEGQNA
jgi:hypothetical protein